ncbi:hypothetical protein BurJ1DRAFT_2784 [Burkholderiales bacterium JOSHI_001]|nr:hypothetical protein BurJ1DRAFT_2784 [Burkholderiales bacterium JOSHI_001]
MRTVLRALDLVTLCAAAVRVAAVLAVGWAQLPAAAQVTSPVALESTAAAPLTQAELDAIVAEASSARVVRLDPAAPGGVQPGWRTLYRHRLARVLHTPAFGSVTDRAKERLIDQAGAWELMPMRRPSQILAQWARWFPQAGIDRPVAPDQRDLASLKHFVVDENWAPVAGGMLAFMECLPLPVWRVHHDEAMLWAMENQVRYQTIAPSDFGRCVRTQPGAYPSAGRRAGDTDRGLASAAVIEAMLVSHLKAAGCSGRGPDRCLPLLQALMSLSPRHPELPAFIRMVAADPRYNPRLPVAIPTALRARWNPETPNPSWGGLNAAEQAQLRQLWRDALLRVIVLTLKLPSLFDQPEAWARDELERDIGALLDHALVVNRAKWLLDGRAQYELLQAEHYPFAAPWFVLGRLSTRPGVAERIDAAFVAHAARLAGPRGCAQVQQQFVGPPPAYWFAWAQHKLDQEGSACDALPIDWVLQHYRSAATAPEGLARIAGLQRHLPLLARTAEGRTVLSALAQDCRSARPPTPADDPWGLCAADQRARLALEAGRMAGAWRGLIGRAEVVLCVAGDGAARYAYQGTRAPQALQLVREGAAHRWRETVGGRVTGRWTLDLGDPADELPSALTGQWQDMAGRRRLKIHLERLSADQDAACAHGAPRLALPKVESDDSDDAPSLPAHDERQHFTALPLGPYHQGEMPLYPAGPMAAPLRVEGSHLSNGSAWLTLSCDADRCALRPSRLRATPVRTIVSPTRSAPGQRLTWQPRGAVPAGPAGQAVAHLPLDPQLAWLTAGPVPTWVAPNGPRQRPDTPGDFDVLLRAGPSGPEMLVPVLSPGAGDGFGLELRAGPRAQLLGSFGRSVGDTSDANLAQAGDPYALLKSKAYLVWAGDLDRDGQTDLALALDPEAIELTLYLSSWAENGALVGLAGTFKMERSRAPR